MLPPAHTVSLNSADTAAIRCPATALGRSQVVRQRILIPPSPGSNPGAPASQSGLSIFRVTVRKEAHNYGAFRASFSLWGSRIRTKISFWCGKSLAFSYEMAVLQSEKVETGSIFH